MKKIYLLIKNQGIISVAVMIAAVFIALSLLSFRLRVNVFIRRDMRMQIEAIQKNSTNLVENELNYLKRLTQSAARLINRTNPETEEDILKILEDYSEQSNIVRSLFITTDGNTYTSYAGYLGQVRENAFIDGIAVSDIKEPMLSKPYYAKELDEVIFEVICPVFIGQEQGVFVSSYDVSRFIDIFENDFIGGTAEIGLLNNKGEVILGKNTEEFQLNILDSLSQIKFLSSTSEEMRDNMAKGIAGFSSYYIGGVERYCSYAPVSLNDWYVIVMVTENSLRSAMSQLETYGLGLTVELLAIMIALLFFIMTARYKEQQKVREILQHAAMIDGLTGIYNRASAEAKIAAYLSEKKEGICCALLVIDVDNFKVINDSCGHVFGDRVLMACASRLMNTFGNEAVIGRMGGDEFVVFIKSYEESEQIYELVQRFISDFYVCTNSGEEKEISLSVGIAFVREENTSFVELYQKADDSLYHAKALGKGVFSVSHVADEIFD